MSTNFFSRILQPAPGEPSVYDAIREHEEAQYGSDAEENIDEQNLGERFHDHDVDELLADGAASESASESAAFLGQQNKDRTRHVPPKSRPRWMRGDRKRKVSAGQDEDVPQSLLLERVSDVPFRDDEIYDTAQDPSPLPAPVPGPSSRGTRVQWDTAQAQQQLYNEADERPKGASTAAASTGYYFATAEEKAMWRWINVENLDNFLKDVYSYYVDKGIWSITLARFLHLLTLAFVVGFGVFLTYCIDYAALPKSNHLPEIIIPRCTTKMSFFPSLLLWLSIGYWFVMLVNIVLDIPRLRHLHDFYVYLLGISDQEMQTVSWPEIVGRLMNLRETNPRTATNLSPRIRKFVGEQSKDRMDAHDIANRIMRKENYFIALFNKDILDTTLPAWIPFIQNRDFYSRNLEWNINQCIFGYVFNPQGQVYQYFLKDTDRKRLVETLRQRFIFYGFMNVLQAPFLISYYLTVYFLRYFTEFQNNPSQIGSRAYTPMAEWKFREFNELWHFFQRRMDMSVPFASRYLDQFPKDKVAQFAKFVGFIVGAVLAALGVGAILDTQNFFNFQLTENRTVLFYVPILTVVWTICRRLQPDDNDVFDPEFAIQNVTEYTHYEPAHWKGRLHSDEVRQEFSSLFQMKIVIFLEEMMSIMFTPLVLWFSLPKCSDRIVDFFREFTVHVDGMGYVCSFALFEFKKGDASTISQKPLQATTEEGGLREDYYSTKDNKMLASYFNFIDSYANTSTRGKGRFPPGRFHPPPAFPGLPSSQKESVHVAGRTAQSKDLGISSSHIRTASKGSVDPSPSLLLDPHHQPPTSLSRRMSKPIGQSRYKPRDKDVVYEDEHEGAALEQQVTSSTVLEEDSRLSDSWKTTRAARTEDEDAGGEMAGDGKGAGVLGLLYQFQKAQTEARGPSVGI